LYPNCKAIGALLSEIFDYEHTDSYVFIYIDFEIIRDEHNSGCVSALPTRKENNND
jgi:hypothetical protein